jgi:hypothetical protein
MADKKISALTGAATPLAGTEVLPIVQSGSTVKVAVSDLTAGRAVAVSSLTSQGTVQTTTAGTGLIGNGISRTGGTTADWFNYIPSGSPDLRWFKGDIGGDVVSLNGTSGNIVANLGNFVLGLAGKGIDFSANTHAAGMTSELLNDYEEGTWTPNQGPGLVVVGAFSSNGTYTKIGRAVTVRGSLIGATSVSCPSAGLLTTNLPFTVLGGGAGAVGNGNVNQGSTLIAFNVQLYLMTAITASASIDFTVTYFV